MIRDEPVSALDLTTRRTVLELLLEIQEEAGVAYLCSGAAESPRQPSAREPPHRPATAADADGAGRGRPVGRMPDEPARHRPVGTVNGPGGSPFTGSR